MSEVLHPLPNLLIIGAMKSGTSSLYADLNRHPDIYFPENKEPMGFVALQRSEASKVRAYSMLYSGRSERYLGDASTGYSKVPIRPDVSALVGATVPDVKVIYLTRDPVTRIQRHLAHHIGNGVTDPELLDLRRNIEYACISAYEMQISYWRSSLSKNSIFQVQFEEYQCDRRRVVSEILEFLELDFAGLESLPARNVNRGASRRSAYRSPLKHVLHTSTYERIREFIPGKLRRYLAQVLLPSALSSNIELTDEDRQYLLLVIKKLNELDAPKKDQIDQVFEDVLAEFEAR